MSRGWHHGGPKLPATEHVCEGRSLFLLAVMISASNLLAFGSSIRRLP